MNTLAKSAPLAALNLPPGDHWVRFHVEEDSISFEVAVFPPKAIEQAKRRKPTGFVQTWGSSLRKQEDANDAWLTHLNDKHLR